MTVEIKPAASFHRDDWWYSQYMKNVKPEDRPYRVVANENFIYYSEDSETIKIVKTVEEAEDLVLAVSIISAPAEDLLTLALEEPERAKQYIELLKKTGWNS